MGKPFWTVGSNFILDKAHEQLTEHRSLHIHPTSGHPAGFPEIHLVYR